MKTKTSLTITGALMALSLIAGTSAFAETQGKEDPMAEAQVATSTIHGQPKRKL